MGKLVLFALRQAALTYISCSVGMKCDQIFEVNNGRTCDAIRYCSYLKGCASGVPGEHGLSACHT
ncbi:hypothetical protein PGTUg99_005808 [Puccinia graminis f. sp. tritici]|uniref:Uncharacterized protein n=1 Tax=Puccinia graminis f. sp. tritici TaxID=56615 RepID=A0A5B0R5U5_PUCGR|nr:hypothetical protein PGTUg99_005808 [Puccinia graminis f. sp. tritici]